MGTAITDNQPAARPILTALPSAHPASPDQFTPDEFCPGPVTMSEHVRPQLKLVNNLAVLAVSERSQRLPSVGGARSAWNQQEAPIAA
jgi:hypothetical protein